MFTLYLACLIFGGLLLAFSIIMGGDHSAGDSHGALDIHADTDHQIDFHSDVGHQLNVGSSSDLSGNVELSGDHPLETVSHDLSEHSADAVKFISFRNFIYFSAFFGLTGTVFELLSISSVITFLSSFGMGTFSAAAGWQLMKYLKKSESGEAVNIYNLVGRTAKVCITVSKERRGKILVQAAGQTIELQAKVSDTAVKDVFEQREEVLIIEIKNNVAYIIESDL